MDNSAMHPTASELSPEDLATLSRNSILAQLDPHELELLTEIFTHVAITPGTELVREGEEGDYMYFILEGSAVVRRGQQTLVRVQAPAHVGELAMLGVRRRAATVTAETIMRLARIGRARYQAFVARHPEAALHLLQAVVASLGDNVTQLTDSISALVNRRSGARPVQIHVQTPSGERLVGAGTTIDRLLPSSVDDQPVIAALLDSKPVSIDTPVFSDARVDPVLIGDTLGRDAFRRSVGLLLLEAAHTVAPHLRVRISHAVDDIGVVDIGDTGDDRAELCRKLDTALQRLIARDVAFHWDAWTVEEARSQLDRQGWHDAARLLRTSRTAVTTLQTCGEVYSLVVGPLVPSARFLQGISLMPHPDGLLLDYGPLCRRGRVSEEGHTAELANELQHPRFGSEMVRAHRAWLAAMGVHSIGDFNELCVRGEIERVIRVAEGFHEKRIGQVADAIAARGKQLRVIGIAGPSSSGKTTFIKRLSVQLEVAGIRPVNLSLDDYFVDIEKSPRDEHGHYDFESLASLDLEILHANLSALASGKAVQTPRYDFKQGRSHPQGGSLLQLAPDQILLIEGIHALNDALWPAAIPDAARMRLFVHPSTTLPVDRLTATSSADLRLLRRIVRDRHGRATSAADSIARWPSVRRGERKHIYPTYGNADLVFDTSLAYELAVLKVYAERYLLEVPEDHPSFPVAYRLRQLIDPYVTIFPDHVPLTSILREFVGGSGFVY